MSFHFNTLYSGSLAVVAGLFVTGCAQIPQLEDQVPADVENADYPPLVPIETLLVPLPAPKEQTGTVQDELQSRRDSLRDQANRLRDEPVVDEETQARMQAGVTG